MLGLLGLLCLLSFLFSVRGGLPVIAVATVSSMPFLLHVSYTLMTLLMIDSLFISVLHSSYETEILCE